MISDDTYVLTTKGLIQARFINVGDELITAMNNTSKVIAIDTEPVLCNKKVVTTYEDIYCSDDLLFQYQYGLTKTINYVYTIENLIGWLHDIKSVKCKLPSICGWIGNTRRIDTNEFETYYNIGFKHKDLPASFETLPFQLRLQILAGIVDSPVATVFNNKIDIVIPHDNTIYFDDVLLLIRTLGYNVHIKCEDKKNHIVIALDNKKMRIPTKTITSYGTCEKEKYPFELCDIVDTRATIAYPFILSRPTEPILVGRMLIPCYIKNME